MRWMGTKNLQTTSRAALREILAARQRSGKDGQISCGECGEKWPVRLERNLQIDRIVPGKYGGEYTPDNCQLTCPVCNYKKGSKYDDEYPVEKPFISTRALGIRWGVHSDEAEATMLRAQCRAVPYGTKSFRWRMRDVKAIETGGIPNALIGQLQQLLRPRSASDND